MFVEDITKEYPSAVKAEQRGNDILILRKLKKPIRTHNKSPLFHYELEYQWINPATGGVLGNEFTYWRKHEVNTDISLFDQFMIF